MARVKFFFFEKKKQKTFIFSACTELRDLRRALIHAEGKSFFASFCSQKEGNCFLNLASGQLG
jgi:hypothetical protein